MSALSKKLRLAEGERLIFWCPGCDETHQICFAPGRWTWNNDVQRPTFSPSIKVTYRHPKGHTNENPAPLGYAGEYVEEICHSFVTDGRIQFLSDCTHALAGQTVDLPEWTE